MNELVGLYNMNIILSIRTCISYHQNFAYSVTLP